MRRRRTYKRQKPSPHGIQLPHMAEVAEVGQGKRAITKHDPDITRIEHCPAERKRALRRKEHHQARTRQRACRCRHHHSLPINTVRQKSNEMRQRRPQRQRRDHHPERRTASAHEPSRYQLKSRRINTSKRHTRNKARHQQQSYGRRPQQTQICRCRDKRAHSHQSAQRNQIRKTDKT